MFTPADGTVKQARQGLRVASVNRGNDLTAYWSGSTMAPLLAVWRDDC